MQGRLFDELEAVADELIRQTSSSSAPALPTGTLRKCAEFFAEHGQHSKAVTMLVHAKCFEEALALAEVRC